MSDNELIKDEIKEEIHEAESLATEEADDLSEKDDTEQIDTSLDALTDKERKYILKKRRKEEKAKKKKEAEKPENINIVKELLSLVVYIGIVILICYFVINYVGCRSRVDGDSMNSTLQDEDNLWVDKLTYRFKAPERFDVIIFKYDENTTYVKRIIGLPGETVRIDENGNIYINGEILEENYGLETISIQNIGRAGQDVTLGEGEYFVLGDNRNNSSDSRWSGVGNVSIDDIVGKVVLRIYPLSKIGLIK